MEASTGTRLSRVPGTPPCAHAQFSNPGGNRPPRHCGVWFAAFRCIQTVGFQRRVTRIPRSATIHISGLNRAACALAFPLLRTPPLRDRTSDRLPLWWLAFDRTELACPGQKHPLGDNDEFQGTSSLSQRPELRSARECGAISSESHDPVEQSDALCRRVRRHSCPVSCWVIAEDVVEFSLELSRATLNQVFNTNSFADI